MKTSIFRRHLCAPFFAAIVSSSILAAPPLSSPSPVKANLLKLPLRFEANTIADHDGQPCTFVARGSGYTVFLGPAKTDVILRSAILPANAPGLQDRDRQAAHIQMELLGANRNAEMFGRERLPGATHYFLGNDPSGWRRHVSNFARVESLGVYPGVDVVFYGNQRRLEFDFVVAPGADSGQIRIGFHGVDNLRLDAEQNLIMEAGGGELRLDKPKVFQIKEGVEQPVSGSFILDADRTVRFQLGRYDASLPLVIDPVLSYSTYLGGNDLDVLRSIAVDAAGNAYVVGYTGSTNFPVTNAFQGTYAGRQDLFISKISADGSTLLYSTYLGGSGPEEGMSIAVDSLGNAYVTGGTESTNFPTANALQPAFAGGGQDAFVSKLNADGSTLLYSTYLGGDAYDKGNGIAVDATGNAYVTGDTGSANFPTASPIQDTLRGDPNIFVTKLNPEGSALIYSTYLGGTGSDAVYAIAVDSAGGAYVTGDTSSRDFPTVRPFQEEYKGNRDAFVAKLNPSGAALDYSTYLGGSGRTDTGNSIAVDASGSAYVAGSTSALDFPTVNAFQPARNGESGDDGFVTKFSPDGAAVIYSTYLGGDDLDEANGIAVTPAGEAYVTGETLSRNFPVADPIQNTFGGNRDAFVVKLRSDGSGLLWGTYLGGTNFDIGMGIAVDSAGSVYVGGQTIGDNFPTLNPLQSHSGGQMDGFIVKMSDGAVQRQEGQIWQIVQFPAELAVPSTNQVRVQFFRTVGGVEVRADAPIVAVTTTNVTVRVPPGLFGPVDLPAPPLGSDPGVTVDIITGSAQALHTNHHPFRLIYPQPIIVDELDVRRDPAVLRNIVQFLLTAPSPNSHTFSFLGRSSDGMVGLRVLNTELDFPQPFDFENNVTVFEPDPASNRLFLFGVPFHIPNLGSGNEGVQFNVSKNGVYVFAVEASTNSPGPFPGRYQLHLAGNVGLPRRLINGVPEFQRGIRLDTLFNHPAPRSQNLTNDNLGFARTALFKFADRTAISQAAVAVLIPPTPSGFASGSRIVRSADPLAALEITTPTARTPDFAAPAPGTVIDFTQVPIPPSVESPAGVAGSILAVLGVPDGATATLPLTGAGGASLTALILDAGSGQEIVNGTGADFRIVAPSGSYTVAVGSTPYAGTLTAFPGSFTGTAEFDLAAVNLTSARYILLTASPNFALDALQTLNTFVDEVVPDIGPLMQTRSATILARRAKAVDNLLDPFIQLIAPSGTLFSENEAGFGDDLTLDKSDAAVANATLSESGFYRFLVKGYDKLPDEQSFGRFFARLETPGQYDQVELIVSTNNEANTVAQKSGTFFNSRQRDSYLFQAAGGSDIAIVVNATGAASSLNPLVELYDPEDFLIAASDDFQERGRNAALLVALPQVNSAGAPLPTPSTYRIVVSAIDEVANVTPLALGAAHVRKAADGTYELKVFAGPLSGGSPIPTGGPRITSVTPASGAAGTRVTIAGSNFDPVAVNNIVRFGAVQATVISASSAELVVLVPAGLPSGGVSLTVSVGNQTSPGVSFGQGEPGPNLTADAKLYCLSLRFESSTAMLQGQSYTLDLTSLPPSEPPNGELFPQFLDAVSFSHASDFIIRSPTLPQAIEGSLQMNIPVFSDANGNEVHDFYETAMGFNGVSTTGEFTTDLASGTIAANWTRTAGSNTGTCQIRLGGDVAGLVPDFVCSFELLEYSGTLSYRHRGTNLIDATVLLTKAAPRADTLQGPILFTNNAVGITHFLDFDASSWTNAAGQALVNFGGFLFQGETNKSNFLGAIGFLDGYPASTGPDYFDWDFLVTDRQDVNQNGVPDILEPGVSSPSANGVRASIRVDGNQIVLEWQGSAKLQSADEVTGIWVDMPAATSPARLFPAGTKKFYRLNQ